MVPKVSRGISTGQLTMEEMALFGHVMWTYLKGNGWQYAAVAATSVVAHKQALVLTHLLYLKDVVSLPSLIGANPVFGKIPGNCILK